MRQGRNPNKEEKKEAIRKGEVKCDIKGEIPTRKRKKRQ